jgi:hypothetical protein
MKDELSKPKYKDMKLVKIAYGNDDDQKSFQETQGLLQAYPNLKGIISPTTVGIAAAARYLSSSKYKGKVQLTGLGTPNQMRKFVKDGTVQAFELWDPAKLSRATRSAPARSERRPSARTARCCSGRLPSSTRRTSTSSTSRRRPLGSRRPAAPCARPGRRRGRP